MPGLSDLRHALLDRIGDLGMAVARPPRGLAGFEGFARFVERDLVPRVTPGLAVSVFDRDGVRFARGFGHLDARARAPCEPSTPFRWFSITKLLTATAILSLEERGALTLGDRVVDHLPWFRDADPDARVTIEDLLAHRSGVGNPPPFRWGRPLEAPGWDVAREVERIVRRHGRIARAAHGRARYTNLGYLVLGELVRAATGEPLEDLARRVILAPLRMDTASFGPARERLAETAAPHELVYHPRPWVFALAAGDPKRFIDGRDGHFVRVHPFRLLGAAFGDLVGSVLDAARFGRMHLGEGALEGARVISAANARKMRDVVSSDRGGTYGLAFIHGADASGRFVFHSGSGIGYRSELRLYPERGFGVCVLANAGHVATEPLALALAELALANEARA
jgi:CubicO group peptidase (beta-lactamase class C family)